MRVADFDYYLPEELIAQEPIEWRDMSRLLVLHRDSGSIEHKVFRDILEYLKPGDVLVINETRVLPARLYGYREGTGAGIEMLLLERQEQEDWHALADRQRRQVCAEAGTGESDDGTSAIIAENGSLEIWEVLVKPGKKARPGTTIVFGEGELRALVLETTPDGGRIVEFVSQGDFREVLGRLGKMPVPPYVKKELDEAERYQTVYARSEGSAAAPTAGLHFTADLLETIRSMGVEIAPVLLHVGLGTFRPVSAETVEEHVMHREYYEIGEASAEAINRAKKEGRRVIAVGTTSVRTLETAAKALAEERETAGGTTGEKRKAAGAAPGETRGEEPKAAGEESEASCGPTAVEHVVEDETYVRAGRGYSQLFVYPGFQFRVVDALVTNFHLPKSTLIMLVSALAGRETVLRAYHEAVEMRYRFFSFGDAMFIL